MKDMQAEYPQDEGQNKNTPEFFEKLFRIKEELTVFYLHHLEPNRQCEALKKLNELMEQSDEVYKIIKIFKKNKSLKKYEYVNALEAAIRVHDLETFKLVLAIVKKHSENENILRELEIYKRICEHLLHLNEDRQLEVLIKLYELMEESKEIVKIFQNNKILTNNSYAEVLKAVIKVNDFEVFKLIVTILTKHSKNKDILYELVDDYNLFKFALKKRADSYILGKLKEYAETEFRIAETDDCSVSVRSVHVSKVTVVSLLSFAVLHDNSDAIKIMLSGRGNLACEDSELGLPLPLAAKLKYVHLVRAILFFKKDILLSFINLGNSKDGFTALHWAVAVNSLETVNVLLSYNANIFQVDRNGENPLELAERLRKIAHQFSLLALQLIKNKEVVLDESLETGRHYFQDIEKYYKKITQHDQSADYASIASYYNNVTKSYYEIVKALGNKVKKICENALYQVETLDFNYESDSNATFELANAIEKITLNEKEKKEKEALDILWHEFSLDFSNNPAMQLPPPSYIPFSGEILLPQMTGQSEEKEKVDAEEIVSPVSSLQTSRQQPSYGANPHLSLAPKKEKKEKEKETEETKKNSKYIFLSNTGAY
jgi:hypothetical protein